MAVSLSLFAGAGAQFFDNNGIPLAGGLLYTYVAGTTTPTGTYTDYTGTILNPNPIVLDSSGRVPNEIWLTVGSTYKFVLQSASYVQIGSYDQISGAATSASLSGGAANQIVYQSGPGVTSFISAPTTPTTFLEWNGSGFTWASNTTSTATNLAGGATNQIPYQSNANTTTFISAPTTANTYLQWTGAGFAWNSSTSGGPALNGTNNWTGSNLFTGSNSSSGVGTIINGGNNQLNATIFQTQIGSLQAAAFTQVAYGGANYALIGGNAGLIVNLGTSEPGTELTVTNSSGLFPYTASGLTLGTSSNPWSTLYASNGSFTGNVSGSWIGSIISPTYGGTGLSSPGATGNVLTSNGTNWVSSPAGGVSLSANNTWTGTNTFAGSTTTGGVGTIINGGNNQITASVFQVQNLTTQGAAFTQVTYSGAQYALIGGNGGLIVNLGTSEPGTELTVTNSAAFFPFTASGLTLGTSANPWGAAYLGTVTAGTWNGTAIGTAYGGTGLTTIGSAGQVLTSNGTSLYWSAGGGSGGSGTVTSVAATVPSFLTVSGSPITTAGTLAISYSGTALPIANGGTGGTTAAGALSSLGASPVAGSTSLTTLGTVTTGTWNANPIANSYLSNSSVTVTAGTGLSGGGTVSLGGSITLNTTLLSATNTWSGGNTFSQTIQATNGINSNVFQSTVGGVAGAAFTQYTQGGSTYGIIGGNAGLIVNQGTTEPGTEIAIFTPSAVYPYGSATLGSSANYWSTSYITTANFGATPSTSFTYTAFAQATGSNGIGLLTYAPSGSESNWDAVIGSSSQGIAYFSVGSPASPTGIGSITYNGTNVVYGTTSDRRLKDNIATLAAGTGLAKITALQPRSFTWKNSGTADIGFIADELQEVVPSAVSGNITDVRADGSIKPQAIDPSLLVVHLVQAVQEMAAEIATLKAKVGV